MRGFLMIAVLVLVACRRPLRPGETRCGSVIAGSTVLTKCETGREPPPPPPSPGWWCTLRHDGLGLCVRQPGVCESWRHEQNRRSESFGACGWQGQAICAGRTCFPGPAACASFERHNGRDPRACVVQ